MGAASAATYASFSLALTAFSFGCLVFPAQECCSASSYSEKLAVDYRTGGLLFHDHTDFLRTYLSMNEKTPPVALRILCFGDSLTAGYMSSDPHLHPYADTMQVELAHWGASTPAQIHVHIDGLSGDQVRGSFMRRMGRDVAHGNHSPYDWIIILGGTNDLGWGQRPEAIYENLQKVWTVALQSKAQILALNVIECASSNAALTKKRNELNEMIAKHEEEGFHTFDLWSVIRYNGIDDETQEKIWDDGLHLTAEGYRIMGKAVAGRLIELLNQ